MSKSDAPLFTGRCVLFVAALSFLALSPAGSLLAATSTWTGTSAVDSNWQTSANWTALPVSTSSLVFAGNSQTTNNNNFAAGTSFAGFTFQSGAGAFVLGGNSVTMTSNIDNQSTSLQTINLALIFAGNRNILTTNGDITINGVISGAGGFNKFNDGTLSLTGANTFTGVTTAASGTLRLDFGAAGAPSSNIINNVANSSALTIRGNGVVEIDGAASTANTQTFKSFTLGGDSSSKGGGILSVKSGAGGSTTVNLGAISTNNGSSLDIKADGGSTVTTTTASGTTGILATRLVWNESDWVATTGTGTLAMGAYSGYNALALTGSNADNALVTASSSLTASVTTNSLKLAPTASGGILDIGASHTLTLTGAGLLFNSSNDYSINNGAIKGATGTEFNVWTYGPGVLTVNSVLGGSGLTKAGTGTLVLNGANNYSGLTYLNQGVLSVSSSGNLGAANVSAIVMASGTLRATASFSLSTSGTNRGVQLHSGGGTFDVTTGNTLTIGGVIADGGSTSSGALIKAGSGTLALTGANTYTGNTVVNAGTLLVNGSLAAGTAATVNNGGTLAGGGTLNGSVTVASGGVLAPGDGVGVLNSGNFNLQSGGTISMELSGAVAYDQLNVTGSVTLAGNLSVSLTFVPADNSLYFLVLNDGADAIAGTFNGLAQGATFSSGGRDFLVSYTADSAGSTFTGGNDVALMAVAVPEPKAALLLVGGIGSMLLLRQRKSAV